MMRRRIYSLTVTLLLILSACRTTEPTLTPQATSSAKDIEPTSVPVTPSATAKPTDIPTGPTSTPNLEAESESEYEKGLIAPAQDALQTLQGATVYALDITIGEAYDRVVGQETVYYTNREEVALDTLYLRLYPNVIGGAIQVDDVTVDGIPATPALAYADSALRVPLLQPLDPGDSVAVSLAFTLTVPQELGGTYGLFGYFDDVLVLDRFYPVIPVYDDEGWNVEVPPRIGDLTHYDASFYEVTVTAPEALTLVASGIDVERQAADGSQTVRFVAGPARDFYLAGSERFAVESETVGETMVNSYVVEEYAVSAETALDIAANALEFYNTRFAPYPYTEFDVVSTPMLALGIEYPGIVGIRLGLYDPQGEISNTPTTVLLESVIVHEVAHQWFYNLVGNDEIDEPWLDEAVVQYATGLYYRDRYGKRAEQSYRQSWTNRWERIDREEIPIGLPSGAYEPEAYSPIVYGRGPWFVDALAKEMGEATFDAFMRDYVMQHAWSIATAETFRAQAEAHCACDLSPLFEAWVEPQ